MITRFTDGTYLATTSTNGTNPRPWLQHQALPDADVEQLRALHRQTLATSQRTEQLCLMADDAARVANKLHARICDVVLLLVPILLFTSWGTTWSCDGTATRTQPPEIRSGNQPAIKWLSQRTAFLDDERQMMIQMLHTRLQQIAQGDAASDVMVSCPFEIRRR